MTAREVVESRADLAHPLVSVIATSQPRGMRFDFDAIRPGHSLRSFRTETIAIGDADVTIQREAGTAGDDGGQKLFVGRVISRNTAAALSNGDLLLFSDTPAVIDWTWAASAVESFQNDRWTGLVWHGDPAASVFMIRADLWQSLDGYEATIFTDFSEWGDLDLDQRARGLGFRSIGGPIPGDLLSARTRDELNPKSYGRRMFEERWEHSNPPPAPSGPVRTAPRREAMTVFTAVTNAYDRLHNPPPHTVEGVAHVAFLDDRTRESLDGKTSWEVRPIPDHEPDPCRRAKIYKILPHRFLENTAYSLWIDGSISMIFPFPAWRLADVYLTDADMCLFRHSRRSCLYTEAGLCKVQKLDDPEIIDAQIARYRAQGYPVDAGLAEGTVILRRHSPKVNEFNEAWWNEIVHGSKRDQLSFNYLARSLGVRYREFPLELFVKNGLFFKRGHAGSEKKRSISPKLRSRNDTESYCARTEMAVTRESKSPHAHAQSSGSTPEAASPQRAIFSGRPS